MTDKERLDYLFRLLNSLALSNYNLDPVVEEIGKLLGVKLELV